MVGDWERAGEALGMIVEHHDGDVAGVRASALAAIVRRADVVIAIAMPNSHNAVAIARRLSSDHRRGFVMVKRLSPSTLGSVVAVAVARPRELSR
jgi:hypothetical protein